MAGCGDCGSRRPWPRLHSRAKTGRRPSCTRMMCWLAPTRRTLVYIATDQVASELCDATVRQDAQAAASQALLPWHRRGPYVDLLAWTRKPRDAGLPECVCRPLYATASGDAHGCTGGTH